MNVKIVVGFIIPIDIIISSDHRLNREILTNDLRVNFMGPYFYSFGGSIIIVIIFLFGNFEPDFRFSTIEGRSLGIHF